MILKPGEDVMLAGPVALKEKRMTPDHMRHPEVAARRPSQGDGQRKAAVTDLRGAILRPVSDKSAIAGRASFEARHSASKTRVYALMARTSG
jgi:hypothetical protein